jgi:hypothetical protein
MPQPRRPNLATSVACGDRNRRRLEMTIRNIAGLAAVVAVVVAALAPSALAGGEPKNERPFTRPVQTRFFAEAFVAAAERGLSVQGEPKNELPFTRPITLAAGSSSGFDWRSGGVGVVAGIGISLVGAGVVLTARKSPRTARAGAGLGR